MKYIITDNYIINGLEISDDKMEEVGYRIEHTESLIDNLIMWINEATRDKAIMKEDLKYLMTLEDDYILSSRSKNEYIAFSDDPEQFNRIAKELTN